MHFEKIRMVNFGPYADESFNFDEFTETPLFLISGKTGAGKSTIFDALQFALFDSETSSSTGTNGRVALSLRSDFAEVGDDTVVTLNFSHQGRQYQIVRAIRVKKTGELDKRAPELTVTDVDGKEQVLGKSREVNARLLELMQLTREQFRQIVLLPQGDFKRFLEADSKIRGDLLGDLFGTKLYEVWLAKVREHASALEGQFKDDRIAMGSMVSSFQLDAGQTVDDGEPGAQIEQLKAYLAADAAQLETALAATTAAQQAAQAAEAQATAATKLTEAFDRQEVAQHGREQLAAMAATQEKRVAQIKELEWVQTQQPLYAQLTALRDRVQTVTQQREVAQQQLATARHEREVNAKTRGALAAQKPTMDGKRERVRHLNEIRAQVAKYQQAQVAVRAAQAAATAAQTQVQVISGQQEQLAASVAKLTQTQAKYDLGQANAALAERKLTNTQLQARAEAYVVAQRNQVDAQAQVPVLKQRVTAATEQLTVAIRKTQGLSLAYHTAQAAILAGQLAVDQPCPVCGSTNHPQPAQPTTADATQADVDAARKIENAARAAETQAAAQLDQAEHQVLLTTAAVTTTGTELMTATDTVDVEAAVLAVQADNVDVNALAKQVQRDSETVQQITAELTSQTNQQQTLNNQSKQAAVQLAVAQTGVAEVTSRLTTLSESLSAGDLDEEATAAEYIKLSKELDEFEGALAEAEMAAQTEQDHLQALAGRLTTLTDQRDSDERTLQESNQVFWQQLGQHYAGGGGDVEAEFVKLVAQLAELPALRAASETYRQQLQANQTELTLVRELVAGQVRPDLAAVRQRAVAARSEASQLDKELGSQQQRQLSNRAVVAKLNATIAKWQGAEGNLRTLKSLQNVLSGNNSRMLSLERYVLGSYFERVLALGSERLSKLTAGRYQFQLNSEVGVKRANRTGLEIDVYDDQAGETRSVKTLSGGESFIASLCLALALGEVIQEESGGIQVDALFIDEGFGSLDATSLSSAMEVLESLEGEHRVVGVISHVDTMKAGIANQLQVIPDGTGRSHLRVVHG